MGTATKNISVDLPIDDIDRIGTLAREKKNERQQVSLQFDKKRIKD